MAFVTFKYLLLIFSFLYVTPEIFGYLFKEEQVGIFHPPSGKWLHGNGNLGVLSRAAKFIIEIEDETGCLYFSQGNQSLAPARGCATQSSLLVEAHAPEEITQRWSLNSDGTIGNACDPSSRLVPDVSEQKVLLKKVNNCTGNAGGRIQFTVVHLLYYS